MRGVRAELDRSRSPDSDLLLSSELVDLVTEAVAAPDDPVRRAEIISEVLLRIVDAVAWRHEPHGDPLEEASLVRILDAAIRHQRRMLTASQAAARI